MEWKKAAQLVQNTTQNIKVFATSMEREREKDSVSERERERESVCVCM